MKGAMDESKLPVSNARPTLLLVDDQQSIRYMLSAGFKAHGLGVFTAASGEKALAFCEAHAGPLDLLLILASRHMNSGRSQRHMKACRMV